MSSGARPPLTANELLQLARAHPPRASCPACAALVCPGWEALSATFERKKLRRISSLRDPAVDDATLLEHHPAGSNAWSADAPIAPAFFPYNRCEVWECVACSRPFLRYTEYGGYYVEERIREIDPALVVDARPDA
jgi:hypothetical protein